MNALNHLQQIDRSQNIEGWNVRIYFASRNPWILMGVAALIIGASLLVAFLLQKPKARPPAPPPTVRELRAELAKPTPDMAQVIDLLPSAAWQSDEEIPVPDLIGSSRLSKTEKLVASAYWSSLSEGDGLEPSADLLYFAHYVKPLRFANELIGDHYAAEENFTEAATYYRRELIHFPEATKAREKLLAVVAETHDASALEGVAANPSFARNLGPEQRIFLAASQHRWLDALRVMGELEVRLIKPVPVTLAALAGLVWFLIALQSIQPARLFSARIVMPVTAVVLGMMSTVPTILSGLWMEESLGLRESKELLGNFLFFMLSVGPREEVMKLAFVVPLIPIFIARKSRLEMLVCAGCVGLGFAIWKNLQYFAQYGSAVAFPRFLTANFFHLALTGVNGLALYDVVLNPRQILRFAGIFLATIVAHGAYDFLMSVPGLPALAIGRMMAFMLISLFYFRTLRALRDGSTDQLSIGATFVLGISLLAGAILVFAAREMGLTLALLTLAVTGFGMIMVGYMFYWQLGAGMSAVEEPAPSPYRFS